MASVAPIRSLLALAAAVVVLLAAAPTAGATTLGVWINCYSAGHGRVQCESEVSGEPPPTPTPGAPRPLPEAAAGAWLSSLALWGTTSRSASP
jgi:hypothetical protein